MGEGLISQLVTTVTPTVNGPLKLTKEKKMNRNDTIEYNGKKIKIPFDIYCSRDNATEFETVMNPFSGVTVTLPKFAAAVYDVIKGAEVIMDQQPFTPMAQDSRKAFEKGITFFQKYFTNEYYSLLD